LPVRVLVGAVAVPGAPTTAQLELLRRHVQDVRVDTVPVTGVLLHEEAPGAAICGKMNHIQWDVFAPCCSSRSARSSIGACAATKRVSSNGSVIVLSPCAPLGRTFRVQLPPNQIERAKRALNRPAVNCNLLFGGRHRT
jgi:hypothetical protein